MVVTITAEDESVLFRLHGSRLANRGIAVFLVRNLQPGCTVEIADEELELTLPAGDVDEETYQRLMAWAV